MITLRKLQLKDVPLMLEWMHDEEAKHIFQNNFAEIDDVAAKKFVENSFREDQQHFAIVDDQDDEYLGTISLKNIDLKNKNAEYAISTRKKAIASGPNKISTINIVAINIIIIFVTFFIILCFLSLILLYVQGTNELLIELITKTKTTAN